MKILNYLNLSNKKSHLDVHVIEKDLLNDPVNVKQKKRNLVQEEILLYSNAYCYFI